MSTASLYQQCADGSINSRQHRAKAKRCSRLPDTTEAGINHQYTTSSPGRNSKVSTQNRTRNPGMLLNNG